MIKIPFNRPSIIGKELEYIAQAVQGGQISGDGLFTKKCHALIEEKFGAKKVLLTTSCTSGLEMSALLCNIQSGDEVILPSFTFVSTANAFCLRGAKPIFVDIEQKTLNINPDLIEAKITNKTKAIVPIHYAGVSCDMDIVMDIGRKYKIPVIEDAAQGVNAKYKDQYLGTIGQLGAYSFHETKNFISGEGGALVINDEQYIERAEIVREKGTNRSKFWRGQVDKYTWVDIGSSYLPSDILAAYLYAQLESMEQITAVRRKIYKYYLKKLSPLEERGLLRLPRIPSWCQPNYHMFYILLQTQKMRDGLMKTLKDNGIMAVFHYLPLHTSPMGKKFGYKEGEFPVTEDVSKRLLRLPFYNDLTESDQERIVTIINNFVSEIS
ncbi:MAG: dTDP-4-amino-4,6-dideoxygalactose transaminase [Bacteroidota bacterium]|nr:dTDP-4-amino-4,6-dideoxygalactose transaminase [Bacteroidota bacterium]